MNRINPDKEHVDKIIAGLIKKNGHCPCSIVDTEDTICPCKEYRETGKCHCRLWVEVEDEDC